MSLFKSRANHFNKAFGFLVLEFCSTPPDRENNKKYDKVIVRNIVSLLPTIIPSYVYSVSVPALSLSHFVIAAGIQCQYVDTAWLDNSPVFIVLFYCSWKTKPALLLGEGRGAETFFLHQIVF